MSTTTRSHKVETCDEVVIVHKSRLLTCSGPHCADLSSGPGVLETHMWFVACSTTLGPDCPVCGTPQGEASDPGDLVGPASEGPPLAAGVSWS